MPRTCEFGGLGFLGPLYRRACVLESLRKVPLGFEQAMDKPEGFIHLQAADDGQWFQVWVMAAGLQASQGTERRINCTAQGLREGSSSPRPRRAPAGRDRYPDELKRRNAREDTPRTHSLRVLENPAPPPPLRFRTFSIRLLLPEVTRTTAASGRGPGAAGGFESGGGR